MGGLWIQNRRSVNLDLFLKWRWLLISKFIDLQCNILFTRHGVQVHSILRVNLLAFLLHPGGKEISLLCLRDVGVPSQFVESLKKKVDLGLQTSFWKDLGVDTASLTLRFSRCFSISGQQDQTVSQVKFYVEGNLTWDLKWKKSLIIYQEVIIHNLFLVIQGVSLYLIHDKQVCHSNNGIFPILSA